MASSVTLTTTPSANKWLRLFCGKEGGGKGNVRPADSVARRRRRRSGNEKPPRLDVFADGAVVDGEVLVVVEPAGRRHGRHFLHRHDQVDERRAARHNLHPQTRPQLRTGRKDGDRVENCCLYIQKMEQQGDPLLEDGGSEPLWPHSQLL